MLQPLVFGASVFYPIFLASQWIHLYWSMFFFVIIAIPKYSEAPINKITFVPNRCATVRIVSFVQWCDAVKIKIIKNFSSFYLLGMQSLILQNNNKVGEDFFINTFLIKSCEIVFLLNTTLASIPKHFTDILLKDPSLIYNILLFFFNAV